MPEEPGATASSEEVPLPGPSSARPPAGVKKEAIVALAYGTLVTICYLLKDGCKGILATPRGSSLG